LKRQTLLSFFVAALLLPASLVRAIDPSEVILTFQGAYARPLGPQKFYDDYFGSAIYAQIEKTFGPKYSLGVGLANVNLRNQAGANTGFSAVDLLGRYWFGRWHAFNPYFQFGVGGNLFRDAYKNPWGDVFHAQAAIGSQYVFDTHWAMDYAVDWHVMAPLPTPYHYAGARLGLSYRYGTQPKVNGNAAPPVQVAQVEDLSEVKVKQVVGKVEYSVKYGDSLYRIAGRPNLLHSPNLWPLIEWDNHISDPRIIREGQKLIVRRNPDRDRAVKALKKAAKTVYVRPTTANATAQP
jgi:hypothetical protein